VTTYEQSLEKPLCTAWPYITSKPEGCDILSRFGAHRFFFWHVFDFIMLRKAATVA